MGKYKYNIKLVMVKQFIPKITSQIAYSQKNIPLNKIKANKIKSIIQSQFIKINSERKKATESCLIKQRIKITKCNSQKVKKCTMYGARGGPLK